MRSQYLTVIIVALLLGSVSCSVLYIATQTGLHDLGDVSFQESTTLSEASLESLTSSDNQHLFIENKGQFGISNIDFYYSIPGGFVGFSESCVETARKK